MPSRKCLKRRRLIAMFVQRKLSKIPASLRFGLDASQSKFIAHALAGGLLWFKGHDHLVAVREFNFSGPNS